MISLTDTKYFIRKHRPMDISNIMTTKIHSVSPSASIDWAIELMENEGIHHLPVIEKDRLVGMVSDRDVLISTGWTLAVERRVGSNNSKSIGPHRVEQIMSRQLHHLSDTSDAHEAAGMMLAHKISAVPILVDNGLVGLVTDTDLIRRLSELGLVEGNAQEFLKTKVKTLMSTPPITVTPAALLEEVVSVFRRFHVRHVPVAEKQKLMGIISDRDVRRVLGWSAVCDMQADAEGRVCPAPMPTQASDIMHEDVKTIGSEESLDMALWRMQSGKIHSLPVVDNDMLIGIITQLDFVRAIAREPLL